MKHELQKGFSLLELLVVMGIIILFSGLSFAAYNNFNEDRKLNDEAKKLINVLNLTSKKTTAAEVNPACSFNGYLTRIVANATPDRYSLMCCNDAACSAPIQIQQYNFGAGFDVVLNPASNTVDIRYLVLSRGVTPTQTTVIKIKNTKINKCINITVAPSGVVTESDKYGTADGC